MNDLPKLLVLAGVALIIAGTVMWSGLGRGWLGKLPGDIHYAKGSFTFYFPFVTCIIISILLTVLLRIFRK